MAKNQYQYCCTHNKLWPNGFASFGILFVWEYRQDRPSTRIGKALYPVHHSKRFRYTIYHFGTPSKILPSKNSLAKFPSDIPNPGAPPMGFIPWKMSLVTPDNVRDLSSQIHIHGFRENASMPFD